MRMYRLRNLSVAVLFAMCVQTGQIDSGFWSSVKSWAGDKISAVSNTTSKVVQKIQQTSFNPRQIVQTVQDTSRRVATTVVNSVIDTGKSIVDNVKLLLGQFVPQVNANNPYRHEIAVVRVGTALAQEEQDVIALREQFIRKPLEKLLGKSLPDGQILRMAFCGSGGGYRAMIGTTGFLVGAQKIGLTDATLYMSGLSGSTWALGDYVTEGLPADEFKAQLQPKTQGMLMVNGKGVLPPPNKQQTDQFVYNLEVKRVFDQPLNSVDLWGALIANRLFEPRENRQRQYLSEQRLAVSDGRQLFPIYTAVQPLGELQYHWLEFTPYEIGSPDLQAFVPTWAFGRPFKDGRSQGLQVSGTTEYAPEQPFGFLLGIFGSAYTVNFTEMLNMMQKSGNDADDIASSKFKMDVISYVMHTRWGMKDFQNQRLSPAKLFNITYQMSGRPSADQDQITLIDAGLDFNLPLPPLLRPERAIDVIFVFDLSADVGKAGELKKAEEYARKYGFKFPQIDYNKARTQAMSVFRNEQDVTVPTIVYLPLIKDTSLAEVRNNPILQDFDPLRCTEEGFCNTFNFEYPAQGFEELTLLTQINLEANLDLLRKTLQDVLELKYH